MHDIEPYFKWRPYYDASKDKKSPFYQRQYSEFTFTNKIYNYHIHPQWDEFGSSTLYGKILYADYEDKYALIELIGEWNDCLYNDVMYLRRNLIDVLLANGINKFILYCDNVLNFHGSDDSYYEDLYQELIEEDGWMAIVNSLDHVEQELESFRLQYYCHFGGDFNDVIWRNKNPKSAFLQIAMIIKNRRKQLSF